MIDWKEILPIEAIAPIIGGLLLWFGLNYIFIAPHVVAPRLAEIKYTPACLAAVEAGKLSFAHDIQSSAEQFQAYAADLEANLRNQVRSDINNSFGAMGELGAVFEGMYAGQINTQLERALSDRLGSEKAKFLSDQQKKFDEHTRGMKHETAVSFCRCNVDYGMGNKMDMALYTSTFRLYQPEGVRELEHGSLFEACGTPPVT